MTTQNIDYYRLRAYEELAAAKRAVDPAIAQIHQELARRYRDRLSSETVPASGGPGMAEPMGGASAGPGTAFA